MAPWHLVRTDNKRLARVNLMRDMLSRLHYAGKNLKLVQPDTQIVFEYSADYIEGKGQAS
jgi:hypothetical protein